ncbi:MAG: hypothetical protein ACYTJ0_19030, partial [Planctomycetota bacterium]
MQNGRSGQIPDGYVAVPMSDVAGDGVMRLCALVRTEPDPAGGRLVTLRDLLSGRVLLGALVDAGGFAHELVELWVQDVDRLSGSPAAVRAAFTNAIVDEQWVEWCRAADHLGEVVVRTGWEQEHPRPSFVDLHGGATVRPVEFGSGEPLQLCRDDALLCKCGLPPYASTLHRYLYVPALGESSPFVPVTADAPRTEATKSLEDVIGAAGDLVPLNPGGGLVQARRFWPIGLEPFADVLGGGSWTGVFHGSEELPLAGTLRAMSQASTLERVAEGHLVLSGRDGRAGRLIETYHLKTRLLADTVAAVSEHVRRTQRPLLGLTADSFRVRLGDPGVALPYLWTGSCVLVEPGCAVPLPVEGAELSYYLRGDGGQASVYRPASGRAQGGRASVRIRQQMSSGGDATIVEGTMHTPEPITPSPSDLVWLRLRVDEKAVNLFASLER